MRLLRRSLKARRDEAHAWDGGRGRRHREHRHEVALPPRVRSRAAWSDEVIIAAQIAGDHLRITVLDQEILGVVMRIPAHVVGDGESSVKGLIAVKNAIWREGRRENRLLRPVRVDHDVERILRRSGLSLDSVPGRGVRVYLREVSNADQGGEMHGVASELHPDHARLALQAAATLGPTLCGVDLIVRDLSAPAAPAAVSINEVNITPALYVANELVDGRPSTYVAERSCVACSRLTADCHAHSAALELETRPMGRSNGCSLSPDSFRRVSVALQRL